MSKLTVGLAFVTCLLFSFSLNAITYTSANSGNWKDPSTWQGGNIPPDVIPVGDIIVINNNHNIFIQSSNIVNNGTIMMSDFGIIQPFNSSSFINQGTMNLSDDANIYTNLSSTFLNKGTITLDNSNIQTFDESTFTNDNSISAVNEAAILVLGSSSFINNATVSLNSESVILLDDSGIMTNNGVINLDGESVIFTYTNSIFTNNKKVTLIGSSYIDIWINSMVYTCDPAPIYNGTSIINNGGSLDPVPAGNFCDDGNPNTNPVLGEVWDGNCNCVKATPVIPTMGQWSLFIFAMILSILGVIAVRQKVFVIQ